ncbi:MAG: DUF262 domain-containing protein [Phycisphaerales bacterium JB043]
MKEIQGRAKNIRALLASAKYAIDYYQREYRWETKQIVELIEDLAEMFLGSYEEGHERLAVESYGHYFLGSIIISDKDGHKFIIDGQQRLTSLTLLLIYIHNNLDDEQQKGQVAELIFSQKYGKRSFNLNVDERTPCMDALFNERSFDEADQPESVVNILHRFADIEEHFPEDLSGDVLPYFADWLIENVYLVEITAFSDADAYTIFETMNDRGLSLTPTDMLKGYLLANISDPSLRKQASNVWRAHIVKLQEIGKEEDADAIKAWLRSQHAQTIRERKKGAEARDFDLIGTEFHRWVRDHEGSLGLTTNSAFAQFIERDFAFYSRWYQRLRAAARSMTDGLEEVFYNAEYAFTLQYPLLLAPLRMDDSDEQIRTKLRIVARYIDIFIARRVWNWRAISYSTVQYSMFTIIKSIRGLAEHDLADYLIDRLKEEELTFSSNDRFSLTGQNRKHIRRMLARITDYIETNSGRESKYADYVARGKKGYDVEHIWANHPDRHTDEFSHPADFKDYRNRIGGLLLLPRSFNASYGDEPYTDKREQYVKHNMLALSLHERAYEKDPEFRRFLERTDLPFEPHIEFKKSDLDARQSLYQKLAEQVWDPSSLVSCVR